MSVQAVFASPGQESPALRRIIQNALIDLRYGRPLGGTYLWNRNATCSDYALLESIFDDKICVDDVLVDVGSGGGRVLNQWLRMGHQGPIYGLELHPGLAAKSARRLSAHANVEIVCGDAVANVPPNGTVFYLFNPFDAVTLTRFAHKLATSAVDSARTRIFYFNCKHLHVFASDPRFQVVSVDEVCHPGGAGQQLATIQLANRQTKTTS